MSLMPNLRCAHCTSLTDYGAALDARIDPPRSGDVLLCAYCGHLSRITATGPFTLEALSDADEAAFFESNPELLAIHHLMFELNNQKPH